jgi:hypothetical protein
MYTPLAVLVRAHAPDKGVDLLGLDVVQAGHSLLDGLLGGLEVNNEHLHEQAGSMK